MVLENRRDDSVKLDCIVYVQEIKPWPPSHSLRSLRSASLHWRYNDGITGSTRAVIPSVGSGVGDGKIRFNESFKLPVSLFNEAANEGEDTAVSRTNYLEFSLYQSHSEKTAKDHLVGTFIVELEKYGDLKKVTSVKALMNLKRGLRATAQPALFLKIQPVNKHSAYSMPKDNMSEASSRKDGTEFLKEYLKEADVPSLADDNVSTSSSLAVLSASDITECSSEEVMTASSTGRNARIGSLRQEPGPRRSEEKQVQVSGRDVNEVGTQHSQRNLSFDGAETDFVSHNRRRSLDRADLVRQVHEKIVRGKNRFKEYAQQLRRGENTNLIAADDTSSMIDLQDAEKTGVLKLLDPDVIGNNKPWEQSFHKPDDYQGSFSIKPTPKECEDGEILKDKRWEEERRINQDFHDQRVFEVKCDNFITTKIKHVKPVQSHLELTAVNGSIRSIPSEEDIKEIDVVDSSNGAQNAVNTGNKRYPDFGREMKKKADGKVRELESKIEMLERELREAAGVEISLYSVVSEHGSSPSKLYAPARRLSRIYLHACRHGSAAIRESSAKSIVSGLVLVTKACANDVPRLVFWLSNLVALRVSISTPDGNLQRRVSLAGHVKAGSGNSNDKKSSPPRKVSSPRHKGTKHSFTETIDNLQDTNTFPSALENIEAWIFSQIIDSLWWQTFTPHMQSISDKSNKPTNKASRKNKNYKTNNHGLGDQEQANFSLELWKKAFKDAREKLCPVRAAGHHCACLPVLARMTMEQCVRRLDVAIFNALLRQSEDEIPTDPVADPICNLNVLPFSAGKSTFGSGAQLKNVIGSWSRCLDDLFSTLEANSNGDDSFNFHLLNQLSDLMMLPKDMLLNKSCREEVCPTLSAPLIQRVLNNFVSDEYCEDRIPKAVFASIDSEDNEEDKECAKYIPCNDASTMYMPPVASSLPTILHVESGPRRNKSLVFRKSCTSDDELDVVDSPLDSFTFNKFMAVGSTPNWKLKENRAGISVRYQLLREVWRDGE